MHQLPWLILVIVYGACIGSFLNVVIYRLPAGVGLVKPRSYCPQCSHQLAWFDNVPIFGWLWLGGKCRYCQAPISVQYPLIESFCALLFGGVYWLDYFSGLRPHLMSLGLAGTWPVLVIQLVMVSGLLAATVIDARLFIIPLRIPHTMTLIAIVLLPVSVAWLPGVRYGVPVVTAQGLGAVAGGAVGLGVSLLLLYFRLLPRSFDEVEETLDEAEPMDAFLSHPHPRREVLKECLFVVLPLVGALMGGALLFVLQEYPPAAHQYPLWLRVIGGVVGGYLVGGGVVWCVRILGTLAFGREAMGLGDVHLLAGIGAVMGPQDAILVFFIAPFFGLAGAVVQGGLQLLWKGRGRVIPYGPYLAVGALVVMVCGRSIRSIFGVF